MKSKDVSNSTENVIQLEIIEGLVLIQFESEDLLLEIIDKFPNISFK